MNTPPRRFAGIRAEHDRKLKARGFEVTSVQAQTGVLIQQACEQKGLKPRFRTPLRGPKGPLFHNAAGDVGTARIGGTCWGPLRPALWQGILDSEHTRRATFVTAAAARPATQPYRSLRDHREA